MATRPEALQTFLDAAHTAFLARAGDPRSQDSLGRIFGALAEPAGPGHEAPARRPACAHLADAAARASAARPDLGPLVVALLAVEPSLTWRSRPGPAPGASPDFADGHANAMFAGPGGLEERRDLWLGVSLLAPGVRYPDHDHAPEETYLVLSEGEFSHGGSPWFAPGPGGSFYNPPGILHAMRATGTPLLALWALWAAD